MHLDSQERVGIRMRDLQNAGIQRNIVKYNVELLIKDVKVIPYYLSPPQKINENSRPTGKKKSWKKSRMN